MLYSVKTANSAEIIAIVEDPVFIYLQDNGSYGSCNENEAEGVVVNGVAYRLNGKNGLKGTEDVVFLDPLDAGNTLFDFMAQISDFAIDTAYRLSLAELEIMSSSDDATV